MLARGREREGERNEKRGSKRAREGGRGEAVHRERGMGCRGRSSKRDNISTYKWDAGESRMEGREGGRKRDKGEP